MKKLILLLTMIASFAFAGQVQVKVGGMVCVACKQSIEKNFKNNAKVQDCAVDVEKGEMTFQVKEGQTLSDGEIKVLLKQAGGYKALEINRS